MTGATADPRADRTVSLEDGRTLAFSEWGDLEGRAVLLFHGVPGAWEEMPEEVRMLTELLRADPSAALDGIRKRLQWYADDPESLLAPGWGGPEDPDDVLLVDPEVLAPMQAWMREGARQGSTG